MIRRVARPGIGSPEVHRGEHRWLIGLSAAGVLVSIVLRLVRLGALPGEMYGDIAIVYEYVDSIRHGGWPTEFELSAGPAYHYLITPVVWITGLDFEGLKIASVVTSLAVLLATYGVARELLDRTLAALSLFVAGVSSWLLVLSRLGNSVRNFASAALVVAIPFVSIVRGQRENFFDGYIGGKIESTTGTWSTLFDNVGRSLSAFNIRGDSGFRSNPIGAPTSTR